MLFENCSLSSLAESAFDIVNQRNSGLAATGCEFINNVAANGGGGVYAQVSASVRSCQIKVSIDVCSRAVIVTQACSMLVELGPLD